MNIGHTKRLTASDLLMRSRSLLRQAKCPECGDQCYRDPNRKCAWCVERAQHIDNCIDYRPDEERSR